MAIIIMAAILLFMNTIAHIFEPPHSIFHKKIDSIDETLNEIKLSNEEIILLLKTHYLKTDG